MSPDPDYTSDEPSPDERSIDEVFFSNLALLSPEDRQRFFMGMADPALRNSWFEDDMEELSNCLRKMREGSDLSYAEIAQRIRLSDPNGELSSATADDARFIEENPAESTLRAIQLFGRATRPDWTPAGSS